MSTDHQYKQAKKIVKKKKEFYNHLAIYMVMFAFFFLINLATLDYNYIEFWFFFPMLPWGIGLAIHYLTVFGIPGKEKILSKEWEEREIQKEMQKLGGEVDEDYLDLNDQKILERRKDPLDWKDSDLV